MAVKYGNLPLGQTYKLLISIIGRDAALATAREHNIPISEKDLDRMFDEKDRSFACFRSSDKKSAMELFRQFTGYLERQYAFPKSAVCFIQLGFWGTFRNAVRGNGTDPLGGNSFKLKEGGLIPYEMPTAKLSLLLLNWSWGFLKIVEGNEPVLKKNILQLLNDTYEEVFGLIIKKMANNKDDFYKQLDEFFLEKNQDTKECPDFNQAIRRYSKGSVAVTWKMLKTILDFVNSKNENELVRRLIGLYLLKNTEYVLKEICGIDQKDIYAVKQDVFKWAKNELPEKPQSESQSFLMSAGKYNPTELSELQNFFIDPDFPNQKEAIHECGKYLWGKTAIIPHKAEQFIEILEKECPFSSVFFASWARGRLDVLSCRFDENEKDKELKKEALEKYHTAFDKGRNFAGMYLKTFLEESIAVAVYFNRKETKDIPDVIDSDKNDTTPITKRAKEYYEYGYALNLFEQESSETFFLHFNAEEHFWKLFSASSFVYPEYADQKFSQDMLKAKGLYPSYFDTSDPEERKKWIDQCNHTKRLWNVTEKSVNTRFEILPGHNVQYTPLSFALMRCQLDIAEYYLEKFANSLDVTVINTNGSTALSEALTQYKLKKFFNRGEQESERYKKIIMEIIKRSPPDALYAETKKNFISVLQEAVNTFDIEIIKAIVEKKGFDIQNLKISGDELSPLCYAIQRLHFVNQARLTGQIDRTNGNINWKKFNLPGMFTEDKQSYFQKLKEDPLFKIMEEHSLPLFIGIPSVWEQEFEKIKNIVKYFIDKTDDVDLFVKEVPEGYRTNALSLAATSDFDDICRLLIVKGANPACVFHNNGIVYDSPFIRAVLFKSWKTLEMLLTDFKDKIKPVINEQYGEGRHTAVQFLFRIDWGPLCQYSINHENFKEIERFIPLFRYAGADFNLPDNYGITVKKILREKGYECLMNRQ